MMMSQPYIDDAVYLSWLSDQPQSHLNTQQLKSAIQLFSLSVTDEVQVWKGMLCSEKFNLNIFGKSKSLLPTVRDIFPFLPVFPSHLGIMLIEEAHEGKAPRSSRIALLGGRSSHLNFWWNKEQPLICTKWKRASIIPWAGRCHRHPQTFQTEAAGP